MMETKYNVEYFYFLKEYGFKRKHKSCTLQIIWKRRLRNYALFLLDISYQDGSANDSKTKTTIIIMMIIVIIIIVMIKWMIMKFK